MKDFNNKKYETLMKKIQSKYISHTGTRISIVKMSLLPKEINKFNIITLKNINIIQHNIMGKKGPEICITPQKSQLAKLILSKMSKAGGITLSDSKCTTKQ